MPRRSPGRSSQSWRTFLTNHVGELVSMDFFVVPTVTFRLLYVLVILTHARRHLVYFNVTEHPTAEWTFIRTSILDLRTYDIFELSPS